LQVLFAGISIDIMQAMNTSLPSYFDATLVINLTDRVDRRRLVEREFHAIGWKEFQFFPAFRFDDSGGFLSPSLRGCFYSHLGCFQHAHKLNLQNILIFEDDIALSSSISRLTPKIIETIRKLDWDFLYFGHEQTGNFKRATRDTNCVKFEPWTFEILTAHFYAVNRRIIPRLIAHFERLAKGASGDNDFGPMPADGAFNTFRRHNGDVNTYVVNPKLGWQRSSRSDISPGRMDRIRAIGPLVTAARSVKNFLTRG
jgi:glycosyl transferase, family 25